MLGTPAQLFGKAASSCNHWAISHSVLQTQWAQPSTPLWHYVEHSPFCRRRPFPFETLLQWKDISYDVSEGTQQRPYFIFTQNFIHGDRPSNHPKQVSYDRHTYKPRTREVEVRASCIWNQTSCMRDQNRVLKIVKHNSKFRVVCWKSRSQPS